MRRLGIMGARVVMFAVLPLLLLTVGAGRAEQVAELWRGGVFAYPASVSANLSDRSCWMADRGGDLVAHLSSTGQVQWQGTGFLMPESVSVNPTDGSCWVADSGHGQVVHLGVLGDVFADVNRYYWASEAIEACAAQNIVAGYDDGSYHPEISVTRDQMAVYIARSFGLL